MAMLGEYLDKVREQNPLIHNITNYVTANDVANMLLACGASPIMADDPGEVEEITALCRGLHINLGTLNRRTVKSMQKAGRLAESMGHAVLLDPVGAGASRLRTDTALRLSETIHFDVIRGNISEIRTLAGELRLGHGAAGEAADVCGGASVEEATGTSDATGITGAHSHGVDAVAEDAVTEDNLEKAVEEVKGIARTLGSVVAVTGAIDLVTDGITCYCIRNGRWQMSRITGTGCQLSGMMTAFLAANPGETLPAAAAAVCAMGLAGEIAWSHMAEADGNATYRNRIIDAMSHMTGAILEEGADYELR